jgi:hypothetical protein
MENPQYAGRLRYLDADDVDDSVVNYDGLSVRGPDGDKLGTVDGFIVDADARRVYYVVVDSGGWFSSRRLLVPVGHANLADDRGSLQLDTTRDALRRYPEFNPDRFREFSDDELRAFERTTAEACCPDDSADVSPATWGYDTRRHYRQPVWWTSESYTHERLRPVASTSYVAAAQPGEPGVGGRSIGVVPPAERGTREHVVARGDERTGDVSPHFEGRAQPGDVLGIETGGERTSVGDTAEEENKRRRDAERATRDDEPRRSER